jgi:dihydroneopterin aldolase
MKLYRTLLVIIACAWSFPALSQPRSLQVERRGDQLHISAPQLRFLQGKALEKLHNGSTVAYAVTLTAVAEHTRKTAFTLRERFVVSYDLWEERYSIVQSGTNSRTVSRLSAMMAEVWILESMTIPVRLIPERQPFMIELACSIEESEAANGNGENSALTLAGIIDIFSRKKSEAPLRWEASSGPLRLSDVINSKQTP